VKLDDGVIVVEYGWDYKEGRIATKGRNNRKVPIAAALREPLVALLLATGRRESDLVFGETACQPFRRQSLQRRADVAWKDAELNRLTPHDCRHSYAALMIAAGVNAKALSTYMGHSSIQITMDRYGHLMPGNEEQAAGLLDTYLARSSGAAG
jgi:integrase